MTKPPLSELKRNHIRWLLHMLSSGTHEWESENERKRFYALMDHFIPELTGLVEARKMLQDELESMTTQPEQ